MTEILVVDDSAVDRRVVGGLLDKRTDFRVTYAEDGTDALRQMESVRPDVVVTDLNMPRKNGLDLVRAMRIHFRGLPVVLITAQGSEELAIRALEEGAASYVPKSLLADKLDSTIDEVLAAASAKRSYERLIGSIDQTQFDFTLENDPALFDPLVEWMQQIVMGMGLCDETDHFRIGMALKEGLSNALIRGNLELPRDATRDDQDAFLDGEEVPPISSRCSAEPYVQRRIYLRVRIDSQRAEFSIRDDGPGFNVGSLAEPGELGSLDAESGRGIVLMKSFLDDVQYNDKGNEVTLTKQRA